jgi:hypothetical protein
MLFLDATSIGYALQTVRKSSPLINDFPFFLVLESEIIVGPFRRRSITIKRMKFVLCSKVVIISLHSARIQNIREFVERNGH